MRTTVIAWQLILAACVSALSSIAASCQEYSGTGNIHEVFAGTETETYLRYLDLSDTTSSESWLIRPLSPPQLDKLARRIAASPWASRLQKFSDTSRLVGAGLLSPSVSARFNSSFPYGSNDAAIWAGRGITSAIQAGAYAHFGPISLTLFPIAFRAENAAFPHTGGLPCGCADPIFGGSVDRPQRFGTTAYQRLDPGQSQLRFDALGLSAGVSTANEAWGPSVEFPFLLGNNAPGFPHVFVGTSKPVPLFIGRGHLRVIYGRLDQSAYSPVSGSKYYSSREEIGRVRFASGAILTFQPALLDGLELGAARFIHSIWPRTGIPSSYIRKPLQAFLKINLPDIERQIAGTDNQVASFFARWAFRPSGLEVYGEYGRDDNSYDLRDFLQEPDHSRAYSLGLAKVIARRQSAFSVLRVELINFQLPPLATTGRGEGGIYIHSRTSQGHTNRGQLLGADVGVGAAAGSTVRWDHYTTAGRWGIFWHRDVIREEADPALLFPLRQQEAEVLHAIGYERVRFTRRFDVTTSLTLMRDLNRDYTAGRFNANAAFSITLPR